MSLIAALSLVATFGNLHAAVRTVGPVGLTVGDLGKQLNFYTNTLPFELVSITNLAGKEQDSLLDLNRVKLRVATLRLGDEQITLTEPLGNKGKPIPADSRSFDHWFQHVAIVVSDMDQAYDRLRRHGVKHVSTSPQTLPDWNPAAGGIRAFYFADPEDHVLEVIFFPPGKGNPKWQRSNRESEMPVFLGIDHTAIVVSDTERSLAFYRDVLGMQVAGRSENHGPEQERLNQTFGARLRITTLRAGQGPGIELLEYIAPPGGRPLPSDAEARDLVFWNTHLEVDEFPQTMEALKAGGGSVVSRSERGSSRVLVRDPDGHALQLRGAPLKSTSAMEKSLVFTTKDGIALAGYDPVAYFIDGRPVKGSAQFHSEHDGARYLFASAEHKAWFDEAPAKYSPAYGGYCGYAASIGKVRPANPLIWSIVDHQLIVQHTKGAAKLWDKDVPRNKARADRYWPQLVRAKAGEKNPIDSLLGKSVLDLVE